MRTFNSDGTDYKAVVVKIKGNMWVIMEVSGKFNYVNVRKATNNPFGGLGKEFPSWEDAIANYKTEMQGALKSAQEQIKNAI